MRRINLDYVRLGRTGLQVSRIALGLGLRAQNEAEGARRLVREALDSGINLMDCANVYGFMDDNANIGASEKVLGQALRGVRDQVIITSKVGRRVAPGPNNEGASRFHIIREAEKTLTRLGTDRIDIYFIHNPYPGTSWEEQLRAIDDLITQGKVLYGGVSNYHAWQVIAALSVQSRTNMRRLAAIQNSYSLLNRSIEEELVPMSVYSGIGLMVHSPLAVGLLAYEGDGTDDQLPGGKFWEGRRAVFERLMKGRVRDVFNELKKIAEKHSVPPYQVAVAWILSNPSVDTVISGSDTANQLKGFISAMNLRLDSKEKEALDRISLGLRLLLDVNK